MDLHRFSAFDYMKLVVGSALVAAAVQFFTFPNSIVSGGVTGIAQIIRLLTGIPVGVLSILINIPIFYLGWRHRLGTRRLILALCVMALISVLIDVYVRDRNAARIVFNISEAIRCFDKQQVEKAIETYFADKNFYHAREEKQELLDKLIERKDGRKFVTTLGDSRPPGQAPLAAGPHQFPQEPPLSPARHGIPHPAGRRAGSRDSACADGRGAGVVQPLGAAP